MMKLVGSSEFIKFNDSHDMTDSDACWELSSPDPTLTVCVKVSVIVCCALKDINYH